MAYQELEGTWEEILAHAPELAGHRLRVTVLESLETEQTETKRPSLAETLRGKIGILDGASPDLSQKTGEKFTSLMEEKYSSKR